MTLEEIEDGIMHSLMKVNTARLIKIYNKIFPSEKKLTQEDISNNKETKEELASLISEEIIILDKERISIWFKRITGGNLAVEDIEDDEYFEDEEEC